MAHKKLGSDTDARRPVEAGVNRLDNAVRGRYVGIL